MFQLRDNIKYKLLPKEDELIGENNNNQNMVLENFSIEEIDNDDSTEKNKKDPYSNFRNLFFLLILVLTLGFSIFVVVSSIKNNKNKDSDKFDPKRNISNDWNFKFDNFGTESSIRLFDIDEDGKFFNAMNNHLIFIFF